MSMWYIIFRPPLPAPPDIFLDFLRLATVFIVVIDTRTIFFFNIFFCFTYRGTMRTYGRHGAISRTPVELRPVKNGIHELRPGILVG